MVLHQIFFDKFKWRLKCLWPYLMEIHGLSKTEIENIWSDIEDVVVKTVLAAHKETRYYFSLIS